MVTTRTTIPTQDGIYSLPEELYRSDLESLSYSTAKVLLKSPKKYHYNLTHRDEKPKRIYDVGHLAHKLILKEGAQIVVLDPEVHGLLKDGITVADSPRSTKMWKEADADARANGCVPVHIDDYKAAEAMAKEVHDHPLAGPLFTKGLAEKAFYKRDTETGIMLKGKVDWITQDGDTLKIVEVKTTNDAHPREFEIRGGKLYYPLQGAFYKHLVQAVGNHKRVEFVTVVVETEAPHLVSVLKWDTEAMMQGEIWMRQALGILAECRRTDFWPEWSDVDRNVIQSISIPVWMSTMENEMVV